MTDLEMLKGASVGTDSCMRKGDVCRGSYICASGFFYMDKYGKWSIGVTDDCWWDTKADAQEFVRDRMREVT